jgi:ABC-2 type transport system permease protein
VKRSNPLVAGLVRLTSFVGKELTEVRRQPRLLLSLVLGPFLILLLFGIGYSAATPNIETVVVLPPEYNLSKEELQTAFTPPFTLVEVTHDANAARQQLQDRKVGVVIYFPSNAYETVAQGQRATLQIDYNDIDPLQSQWIQYYAYVQTNELNKRVLVAALQQNGAGQGDQRAAETRDLAGAMHNDAAGLQNDLNGNNRDDAQQRIVAIRQNNQKVQANLTTAAQALGGLALFGHLQNPQDTPQGKALAASGEASNRINNNLDQIQADLIADRASPHDADLARQIQDDSDTIANSSGQFKTIPPDVLVSPFQEKSRNISAISPDFVEFYAPAVISLLIQHIAVTLTALTLVRERLLGSVELFRVSPASASEITFGKYLSYFLLTIVLGALLAAAMHFGLGVHILAGYGLFAAAAVLLTVAALSLGFFISAISNSESQAVQLSMLVLLASVFFGGFFLPLTSLAPYVRVISYLLPVTYGIKALQAIMLRGEFPPLYTLIVLGGMALGLYIISTIMFRRHFKRG